MDWAGSEGLVAEDTQTGADVAQARLTRGAHVRLRASSGHGTEDRRFMSFQPEVYYRLAPGVHAVPLADGGVLFRSDAVSIRVEGDSAQWLAQQVIPLLDGRRGLSEVASSLPASAPADLRQHLDALVEAWVLRREDRPQDDSSAPAALGPWLNFLHNLGIAAPAALEMLAGAGSRSLVWRVMGPTWRRPLHDAVSVR